ncbi:MAG: NRDE family protein [Thermoleophilia bacterium]|nr:NRDE family protein [Thermoleophilia bacterium]
MCTVLLRLRPDSAWPVRLAFVRDEDRDRPSDPPARWWPQLPHAIGGRDARAGGTWLAVDLSSPTSLAMLTDRYDPTAALPDLTSSPTRGTLPLVSLERGPHFDLEADVPGGVAVYQPFHLASLQRDRERWIAERWSWTGSALDHARLDAGDHVIASRASTLPGELQRRARLLAELEMVDDDDRDFDAAGDSTWSDWIDLLDARSVQPDQLDAIAIHSVAQRPGFGTVGASLVAIAADGRVRYDINRTPDLSPDAWRRVPIN